MKGSNSVNLILLPFPNGSTLKRKKAPFWKGYVIQGSKWEVSKLFCLGKTDKKHESVSTHLQQ